MKAEPIKFLESSIKSTQMAISILQECMVAPSNEDVESIPVQIKNRRLQLLKYGVELEYDASDMHHIENGNRNPSLRKLNKIATMLGCHLELVPNDI